jgi:hypothetical protein
MSLGEMVALSLVKEFENRWFWSWPGVKGRESLCLLSEMFRDGMTWDLILHLRSKSVTCAILVSSSFPRAPIFQLSIPPFCTPLSFSPFPWLLMSKAKQFMTC